MKMMNGTSVLIVVLLGLAVASSCSHQKTAIEPEDSGEKAAVKKASKSSAEAKRNAAPKRIIFLIGDGLGVPALTAATYAKGAPLSMLGMDKMGLATTHSYDFATTDSAAAATALAAGRKTHFEGVSVTPGTTVEQEQDPAHQTPTILEKAEAAGWKTGLVATVRLNHATPGAFAAHRVSRHQYDEIALDMSKSGVDVMIGGGRKYFNQRKDGKDLLAGFKKNGYAIANSPKAMLDAADSATQMIALLDESDFAPAQSPERVDGLPEMMGAAIDVLDRDNKDGFFLMVEGSQIDWRAHGLDGAGVVKETLEFDNTVQAALEYAAGRDDTLVVVTSDHETGGLSVLDSANAESMLDTMGGAKKAQAMVSRPEKIEKAHPSPELLPAIKVGQFGDETPDFAGLGGLSKIDDATMRLGFGHLSLESRGICQSSRRFSATHTSDLVGVFAQGPGAQSMASSGDNAVLGARLMALVGAQTVPDFAPREDIEQVSQVGDQKPLNIILMIGDGMGIGAVTAGYYANGPLAMQSMPVQGLVSTHATDRLVNDSAAAATALSTGERTHYGGIGGVAQGKTWKHLPSVLERSEQRGMKTGLVTTVGITHATPAAFYAHVPSRGQTPEIARALVDLGERVDGSDGIDLVYAGGASDFSQTQFDILRKEHNTPVYQDWQTDAPSESAAGGRRLMRLIAPGAMPTATERHNDGQDATPTLARMTSRALANLSAQASTGSTGTKSGVEKSVDSEVAENKGFFLMVEGAQIDWAQHGVRRDNALVDEVVDFDQAVGAAVDFARKDGNTLVIVTADHDHTTSVIDQHYGNNKCARAASTDFGGPFELKDIPVAPDALGPACEPVEAVTEANADTVACAGDEALRTKLQGDFAPLQFSIQYAWSVQKTKNKLGDKFSGPHSANFVPLFAMGPGSSAFEGFHDQPEVGRLLQTLVAPK